MMAILESAGWSGGRRFTATCSLDKFWRALFFAFIKQVIYLQVNHHQCMAFLIGKHALVGTSVNYTLIKIRKINKTVCHCLS